MGRIGETKQLSPSASLHGRSFFNFPKEQEGMCECHWQTQEAFRE